MSEILSDQQLIQGYQRIIENTLIKIGLHHLKVNGSIESRPTDFLDNRLVFGLSSITSDNLAILASAQQEPSVNNDIYTLLALPAIKGSTVFTDGTNLATDFFCSFEDYELKFIKTSNPVPIDLLYPLYSYDFQDFPEVTLNNLELYHQTSNKWGLKSLLAEKGVAVPRGILLSQSDGQDPEEAIKQFMQGFNHDIVVKWNKGSRGRWVKMFEAGEVYEATDYVKKLHALRKEALVEERQIPYPPSESSVEPPTTPEDIDYNFRVLMTFEAEPRFIDWIVRYGLKNNDPKNISRGAEAIRPEAVFTSEQEAKRLAKVKDNSYQATRILYQMMASRGRAGAGLIGWDVMVNKDEQAPILEGNSGAVGGFDSLCALDGQPLKSIKDILLPSLYPFLERNYRNRADTGPFKRMSLSCLELVDLGRALRNLKKHQEALGMYQQILLKESARKEDLMLAGVHFNLYLCLRDLNHKDAAFEELNQVRAIDPFFPGLPVR